MRRYLLAIILLLSFLLSGCGKREGEMTSQSANVVNFRAIYLGNAPEEGLLELYRKLDELTVGELGCTIRFEFIPWGNEREQLNIAIASGEYDFIPGGVFSDYRILVSRNAFLDLNEYLYLVPELADHYGTYSETALKDCEISGGLYGIPQFGPGEIKNVNEGFFYREDLRKAWELPEITDLNTMEMYLYRAKEEERYRSEPLITDNRIWQSLWLLLTKGKYLEISSMQEMPFVVVSVQKPDVVLNRLEQPEFLEVLSYIEKWRRDGILESDLLAMSDNEGERGKNLMQQDRKPCETNVPIWSAEAVHIPELTQMQPEWEYGFFPYTSVNEEWYIGTLADSSVISISSKTTEPEIAIKLLEKIHTDQRYYNLMKYGVEGIHYRMQDGKISYEEIEGRNKFGWTVCSDDLMNCKVVPINGKWYEEAALPVERWRNAISKEAKSYPLENFTFSAERVYRELEALNEVKLKYFQPLVCGYTDDCAADLEETKKALEEAGLDLYIASMQEQISKSETPIK